MIYEANNSSIMIFRDIEMAASRRGLSLLPSFCFCPFPAFSRYCAYGYDAVVLATTLTTLAVDFVFAVMVKTRGDGRRPSILLFPPLTLANKQVKRIVQCAKIVHSQSVVNYLC